MREKLTFPADTREIVFSFLHNFDIFPTRPYGSVEGKYVGGEMLDWRRALQKTNRASTNSVKMIIINICDHLKLIMIIIPFQSLLSF